MATRLLGRRRRPFAPPPPPTRLTDLHEDILIQILGRVCDAPEIMKMKLVNVLRDPFVAGGVNIMLNNRRTSMLDLCSCFHRRTTHCRSTPRFPARRGRRENTPSNRSPVSDPVRLPEAENNHLNFNFQHRFGMMMMGPNAALSRLVTFHNDEPVYIEGGDYGLGVLPPNPAFIAAPGWQCVTNSYYAKGNSGWAAYVTRHMNTGIHRIGILKQIRILCWNSQTQQYEPVFGGTFPPMRLTNRPVHLASPIALDACASRVQIGMVCALGLNRFALELYVFDINNRSWNFTSTPHFFGRRVGVPLIATALTI